MSLLDDVSIVVTPNGYKAGELYAVVPVPTEGAEEITNGDFATDSDWSKATGVTISGGNAIFNNSTAGNNGIYQGTVFQANTQYKITAEVSNYSSGNVTAWSGGSQNINSNESFTGNGTKTWIISTGASNGYFLLSSATTNGNFNIDNVSVKEYTAADMDVTRATAATRVDENGLVNYAEVVSDTELITNGDFATDTDWIKGTGWTISGGAAILDGTQTGGSSLSSSNMTVTVGKIYKVTVNVSATSSGFRLYDALGVVSYGLSLGENIFYRTPSSSTYTLTPLGLGGAAGTISNVSVKQVDRDNVPRIDYTGGGCPHILAEPQRTNLLPYSEAFGSWHTVNNVTITQDTTETTSPSGTNNASKILVSSASTPRRLFEVISTSSGSDYTFTLYAKKGTTDFIRVYFSSSIIDISFDLTNGTKTVTAGTGSIESVGNDWYRIQGTGTSSLTTEVPQIQLSNSASVNDYLYIWGAQLEEGSYPTSYIPTSGSTVTRNQDIFTRDGIGSLINSTEGVLFVEMAALSDDGTNRFISISNGNLTDRVVLYYNSVSNRISSRIVVGGTSKFLNAGSQTQTNFNKIAIKWKLNDYALWINGFEVDTDTSGSTFTSGTLNNLSFNEGDGSDTFYGKVRQLQVYDTALTDTQLAALTS